jgi:hypothetical protein
MVPTPEHKVVLVPTADGLREFVYPISCRREALVREMTGLLTLFRPRADAVPFPAMGAVRRTITEKNVTYRGI